MSWFTTVESDIKADALKVEAWIKGVDWSAVIGYYDEFVKGLETAVEPVLEALFPGTASTISEVVNPLLTQATTAITALTTAAQAYQSGTLSASTLTTAAKTVETAVVAANAVVGAAVSGLKSSSTTTATTTPAS